MSQIKKLIFQFKRFEAGENCFHTPVSIGKEDDESVDWFGTQQFQEIEASTTPGLRLRAYRKREGLSQAALAKVLGVSPQVVCDLEKGRRVITAPTAKALKDIFKTRLELWL